MYTADQLKQCVQYTFRYHQTAPIEKQVTIANIILLVIFFTFIPCTISFVCAIQVSLVDDGFAALRKLHEFQTQLQEFGAERDLHRDRKGIRFHVGDIVKLKDGKRAVVIGWDRNCKEYVRECHQCHPHPICMTKHCHRHGLSTSPANVPNPTYFFAAQLEEQELQALDNGPDQALYYLLKDRGIGDIQMPDEDVQSVSDEDKGPVDHDDIQFVFERFGASSRRYYPIEILRFVYPDQYPSQ